MSKTTLYRLLIWRKMTRRESREAAFQTVFGMAINSDVNAEEAILLAEESGDPQLDAFSKNLIFAVYNHRLQLDEVFQPFLKDWSIDRISKTALAILRISCAQLLYWNEISDLKGTQKDDMAESVIINEAVELAKKYGNDDDYAFVNGVLGNVVRNGLQE